MTEPGDGQTWLQDPESVKTPRWGDPSGEHRGPR